MAETRREAGGPAPAAPAAEGEALRWREVSPPPALGVSPNRGEQLGVSGTGIGVAHGRPCSDTTVCH